MKNPEQVGVEPRQKPDRRILIQIMYEGFHYTLVPGVKISTQIQYDFGIWICFYQLGRETSRRRVGHGDGVANQSVEVGGGKMIVFVSARPFLPAQLRPCLVPVGTIRAVVPSLCGRRFISSELYFSNTVPPGKLDRRQYRLEEVGGKAPFALRVIWEEN